MFFSFALFLTLYEGPTWAGQYRRKHSWSAAQGTRKTWYVHDHQSRGEKKKPDIHSSKESLRPIWRPKKVEEFNSGAENNQNWDFFFVDRRDFLPRRSQVGKKMKS